jgi:hypothetical protein
MNKLDKMIKEELTKILITKEFTNISKNMLGEAFKPGDMWSKDFDYKGMMKFASTAKVSMGLKKLEQLYGSLEDVNYHTENQLLGDAIDHLKSGDKKEAEKLMGLFNKKAKATARTIRENKADGYKDPAYRATVKQFKGKKASKKEFAQALAMHHDSMDEGNLDESGILYKAGVKKYGKDGMAKILKLAGEKDSDMNAKIGKIKDQYDEGKLNEAKFYITYNKGRGQGKALIKSSASNWKRPQIFNSYKDAEAYIGSDNAGPSLTAYWVSDDKMNRVNKYGEIKEGKLTEAKLPKRFTVKKKQRIDGTVYNPGDYALKKKRSGGGIYLNMDNGEMLGIDARNIPKLEESKLTEMQMINKKTGKDVTKHFIAYLEKKITKKEFEKLTGFKKEKVKVSERLKRIVNARARMIQEESQLNEWEWPSWNTVQDVGQGVLSGVGMIPGVGNLADLANAGWSAGRGNYADAALNLAAAVPGAGLAVGGTALANKGNKLYKGLKAGEVAADVYNAGSLANTAQNTVDKAVKTNTPPKVAMNTGPKKPVVQPGVTKQA